MCKELTGYLNSIKKPKAEMKVTLREIKTYREPIAECMMKPRIKSLIWNIRKKKTFNQNSKKKMNLKKMRIC